MDRELMNIISLVENIQIAARGEKEPTGNREEYIADVNVRITGILKGVSALKSELTKQGENNWE